MIGTGRRKPASRQPAGLFRHIPQSVSVQFVPAAVEAFDKAFVEVLRGNCAIHQIVTVAPDQTATNSTMSRSITAFLHESNTFLHAPTSIGGVSVHQLDVRGRDDRPMAERKA